MSDYKRVLIIEDEALTSIYIKRMILEKLPMRVIGDFAISVDEAVEYLEEKEYDLITFDMNLPDGTGHDVYDRLPDLNKDTPRIIMTGYSYHDWSPFNHEMTNAEYFYALGFDSFWDKMMITTPAFRKHLEKLLNIKKEKEDE